MPSDGTPRGINDPTLSLGGGGGSGDSGGERASNPVLLPERYQIRARLGAGGMGEVVLATDTQIGRDVAIKRMRVAATPSLVARFVREAKIQAKLDHPAIVPVHELGADADGQPFFVMKRLAGTTLADVIATNAKSRQKMLRAFADVCLAIELAHTRGIVHRDLKPANIMLGDFGEVYVLDWGVARMIGEVDDAGPPLVPTGSFETEAGALLGTPGYISPEVEDGEPADARADVYALGCILFEILTGEPVGKLAGNVAPRPSTRTPDRDIPPELDALCVEATHDEPDARIASARAMADRVERYLDGDRDAAARKQLAATHLSAARAAVASAGTHDDTDTYRADAMREAGHALALDPTSGAAELIGSLMLSPPRRVPREVEARMADIEGETAYAKLRGATFVTVAYFLFVPFMLWLGFRESVWLGIFIAVCGIDAIHAFVRMRGQQSLPPRAIYTTLALNAIVMALFTRMFSPLLIAPGITAVTVMSFANDMRLRMWVLYAMSFAGVFVPWVLEIAGACSRTIATSDGDIVLRSPALLAGSPATELGMAVFVAVLIGFSAHVSRNAGRATRAALERIEMQAWHLRQLAR